METIEITLPSKAELMMMIGIISAVFYLPTSFYLRAYAWFTGLPRVARIRKRLVADPPLFGERRIPKRPNPTWKSIPAFVRIPSVPNLRVRWVRFLFKLMWALLIFVPYTLYFVVKQVHLLADGYWSRVDPSNRRTDFRASTLLRYFDTGKSVVEGGRKGGGAKARLDPIEDRHQEIRRVGQELLDSGREFSQLSDILHRRFSDRLGYPKSQKQYRNIIAPLRKKSGN